MCPDCGYLPCACARIKSRPLTMRHCAFCPNGGLRTFHGKCTDPFGDKGICYCFSREANHRLAHEKWRERDDDEREGYDGLDSSRQTVAWQEEAQIAAMHAAQTGAPI